MQHINPKLIRRLSREFAGAQVSRGYDGPRGYNGGYGSDSDSGPDMPDPYTDVDDSGYSSFAESNDGDGADDSDAESVAYGGYVGSVATEYEDEDREDHEDDKDDKDDEDHEDDEDDGASEDDDVKLPYVMGHVKTYPSNTGHRATTFTPASPIKLSQVPPSRPGPTRPVAKPVDLVPDETMEAILKSLGADRVIGQMVTRNVQELETGPIIKANEPISIIISTFAAAGTGNEAFTNALFDAAREESLMDSTVGQGDEYPHTVRDTLEADALGLQIIRSAEIGKVTKEMMLKFMGQVGSGVLATYVHGKWGAMRAYQVGRVLVRTMMSVIDYLNRSGATAVIFEFIRRHKIGIVAAREWDEFIVKQGILDKLPYGVGSLLMVNPNTADTIMGKYIERSLNHPLSKGIAVSGMHLKDAYMRFLSIQQRWDTFSLDTLDEAFVEVGDLGRSSRLAGNAIFRGLEATSQRLLENEDLWNRLTFEGLNLGGGGYAFSGRNAFLLPTAGTGMTDVMIEPQSVAHALQPLLARIGRVLRLAADNTGNPQVQDTDYIQGFLFAWSMMALTFARSATETIASSGFSNLFLMAPSG